MQAQTQTRARMHAHARTHAGVHVRRSPKHTGMHTWSASTMNYTARENMINCLQSNLNLPGPFREPCMNSVLNQLLPSAAVFNAHLPFLTLSKRLMPPQVRKKKKRERKKIKTMLSLSEPVGFYLSTNMKNI